MSKIKISCMKNEQQQKTISNSSSRTANRASATPL